MRLTKIILFTAIFFTLFSCDFLSGNSKKERELFEKIQPGMTVKNVKDVLGKPDWVEVDSSSNNAMYYYYFTENKSVLRSELPYVLFDSTGVVTFSTYGEGG